MLVTQKPLCVGVVGADIEWEEHKIEEKKLGVYVGEEGAGCGR